MDNDKFTGHTAGPWSAYRRKSGLKGLLIISQLKTIAAVSESEGNDEEIKANAALLAAAPGLLAENYRLHKLLVEANRKLELGLGQRLKDALR